MIITNHITKIVLTTVLKRQNLITTHQVLLVTVAVEVMAVVTQVLVAAAVIPAHAAAVRQALAATAAIQAQLAAVIKVLAAAVATKAQVAAAVIKAQLAALIKMLAAVVTKVLLATVQLQTLTAVTAALLVHQRKNQNQLMRKHQMVQQAVIPVQAIKPLHYALHLKMKRVVNS